MVVVSCNSSVQTRKRFSVVGPKALLVGTPAIAAGGNQYAPDPDLMRWRNTACVTALTSSGVRNASLLTGLWRAPHAPARCSPACRWSDRRAVVVRDEQPHCALAGRGAAAQFQPNQIESLGS
jgi:hypothetical protein